MLSQLDWVYEDLAKLQHTEDWFGLLDSVDWVVNCAGALQSTISDKLQIVHVDAVSALARACAETNTRLVQISAVGTDTDPQTSFLKTKAQGDAAIRASGAAYWLFRPGLVIGQTAHGGSLLLRMLAAFPFVQPLAMPDSKIQTIAMDDVVDAVILSVRGDIAAFCEFDLVEDTPQDLAAVVMQMRNWLGFSPARYTLVFPRIMVNIISFGADILGWFGWRPPLRSNAIVELENGVTGDPHPYQVATGKKVSSLSESLMKLPVGLADRQMARMALLMPVTLATLLVFWLTSGVIGFLNMDAAILVLTNAGWSEEIAKISVGLFSATDIGVGLMLLWRKIARLSCVLMIVIGLFYLAASTFIAPQLWFDPLGPLVKIVPAIMLAALGRVLLEAR